MERRLGGSESTILIAKGNLANEYAILGRTEDSLLMRQEVYSGTLRLKGEEHFDTIREANNYAMVLLSLERVEEAKRMLRKVVPVARRVLGTEHELTLSMREDLSRAILDGGSSANEKRQALQRLEDTVAVMRRVLGPAHPDTINAQEKLEIYRRKFPGA